MTSNHTLRLRSASKRSELDRSTWAQPALVVFSYDSVGSGQIITENLEFGTVFEDIPFFTYGVELIEGQDLVAGDYPFVSAGVNNWITNETEDSASRIYYLGANIYINVASYTQYLLRFRFSFEGIVMKNVEFFKGTS